LTVFYYFFPEGLGGHIYYFHSRGCFTVTWL
jgi:hypothetical protein